MKRACQEENPECPFYDSDEGCFSDTHHLYWPKLDYRGTIAKEFRNLPENKEQLCRFEHVLRHMEQPPEIPSRSQMLAALAIKQM